jgi:hypothetical protein
VPIDPKLLTGFEETANWTRTDYTGVIPNYQYILPDGGRTWSSDWIDLADDYFTLAALTYWWIILIGVDTCKFITPNGTSRGTTLSIDEIEGAGAFVVFWNTTLYADPQDAHDNDVLNLLHGVGFSSSATNDIGSLLVGLLFLSLPDVPVLVNVLLATPIWACIIYVLWYVIKEMIPFL